MRELNLCTLATDLLALFSFEAIDLFQEHVLKKGSQNNESLVDHLKDKMIAETIRNQVEKVTGLKRS
jgi:hypothetical protein